MAAVDLDKRVEIFLCSKVDQNNNVASEERMILNDVVSMGQILNSKFRFGTTMIMNNVNTYALLNFENKLEHVMTGALVYDKWLMMILRICDSWRITYMVR